LAETGSCGKPVLTSIMPAATQGHAGIPPALDVARNAANGTHHVLGAVGTFLWLKAQKHLPALRAALEAHRNKNSHGVLARQANAA
jgi:hypothetical protein